MKKTYYFLLMSLLFFAYKMNATDYISRVSGSWTTGTNWTPTGIPGQFDNVTILNAHTMSHASLQRVNNITINAGGTLRTMNLIVYGTLTNNGTFIPPASSIVNFYGTGTVLAGTGTFTIPTGAWYFYDNQTIAAGVNITSSGSLYFYNDALHPNIHITNYGNIHFAAIGTLNLTTPCILTNGTNATFRTPGLIPAIITLNASATGNTMVFSGTSSYTINTPTASTFYNVTIVGGGTKTIPNNLILLGSLSLLSATNINSINISIGGDWFNNNVTLTSNASTVVTFNGSSPQLISKTSGTETLETIIFSGSGVKTLGANLSVGALTINSGSTLDASASDHSISITKNWINNNGTFTPRSGTVTFSGTTQSITSTTTETFHNLTMAGSNTKTLGGGITLSGTLTINTGVTLDVSASNYPVSVAGNWSNSGTFVQRSGTVNFNGTTIQSITASSSPTFYRLVKSNTSAAYLGRNTVVTDLFTITGGIFDVGSAAITGTAGLTMSSGELRFAQLNTVLPALTGAYNLSAGKVTFYGTGTQRIRNITYFDLETAGTGTKTPNNSLDINGTLTISTSSTLDVTISNYGINCAGNWINNGVFNPRNGTVTFDGTTTVSGSSITNFRNLTVTGSLTGHTTNMNVAANWINNGTFTHNSGTVTFNGITTISGSSTSSFRNVAISGALTGYATNMNVAGNWTNSGTFTHNSGTVTFNGITAVTGVSTTDFNNVTINGTFTGHPSNMSIAGNWVNNGTYSHNSGTTTFNGTSVISGSSISTFYTIAINGILTGHTTNLNISGDFNNNGTYNSNSGLITFNGLSAQVISGSGTGTFESLTLSNASGLSINSGTYNLEATLTITAGTLANIGGSITLTSDASRYARIDAISAGCGTCGFSGDFTIQRHTPSRSYGTWANLSSPVSNATMSDWDNDLFMVYPFLGFDTITGRPKGTNVLAYDEVSANYYELNSSTPLSPTQGFEIGLTDDGSNTNFSTTTLSTTGTPNFGTFNIPLSFTAANGPAYPVGYSGENLVGNPFASAVAISGMTIINALSTVDVYDYTIDNYTTLTSSDVIGPYQGFWAYAQLSGASILIPETAKITDNDIALHRSAKKEARPYLNLTLSSADGSNTMAHTLMVACNENASDEWDASDHPFRKSLNPKAPSITANAGEAVVSINTFNNKHETYMMPLNLNIGIEGKYQLLTSGIENVNDYAVVLLEDKLTHTFINLNNSNNYIFSANTTDSKQRFALHFSKSRNYTPVSTAIVNNLANEVQILQNNTGNTINFNLAKAEQTVISVMDLLGKNIIENLNVEANNQSINITLPENFHGLYFITIQSASGKTVKKFVTAK